MNPTSYAALAHAVEVIALAMTLLWLASGRLHNVAIVDVFWSLGFVAIAATSLVHAPRPVSCGRAVLMVAIATWGVRLAGYLYLRNRGRGEDYRYQALRRRDPSFAWTSLIKVFYLQGALMMAVAAPLWAVGDGAAPERSVALTAGVVLFAIGLFFEAVGDRQLARFRAEPANRGKVMDRGLWRLTRHPNYFGDTTLWWGFYLMSLANGAPAWSAVGPLLMTILLLRVSGVALLERSLTKTKPQYADYVRRTSAFFPRPPKA